MTHRTHVCFDGVLDAARSGGWRVFTSTLRALAHLGELRLSVILPRDRVPELDGIGGLELIPVAQRPERPLPAIVWRATKLPALLRRIGAEVFHVPSHNLLIARHVCPTVVTIHDLSEFHLPRHYDPIRMFYRGIVVPRNARIADRIATVSEWVGRDIITTLGVPPERIVVTANGVDPAFRPVPAPEAAARVRAECGIDAAYVLYVGQIHMPNKNLVRLVEAFARARAHLPPETRLVLAGREVAGDDEVRAAVRAHRLDASVVRLGYVKDAVLPSLYSAALALGYVSLQEGFGLPVLEAMSCGTPVVTSGTTALGEVAAGAALLVDPTSVPAIADALIQAASDQALRVQLRRSGLERAAQYTWDSTAAKLAALYHALAKR